MTVLFIDTRDRLLSVWTASVTQTATGLVLRLAAQLGSLAELVANRGRRMEFPLVIGTGGYQAQSSAGFVSVRCGSWGVARPDIVGGTGFGYEKYLETEGRTRRVGDGLRRFREPLPAVFLPAGCTVETVLTHGNSNHDTANAAVAGLELLGAGLGVVVIAEGQSDRTRGFAIRGFAADRTGQGWREEMPLEHRLELFTLATAAVDEALRAFVDQRVASKVADRRVCWRVAEHLAAMFAAANALDELPEFAGAVEAVGIEAVAENLRARLDVRNYMIEAKEDGLTVLQRGLAAAPPVVAGRLPRGRAPVEWATVFTLEGFTLEVTLDPDEGVEAVVEEAEPPRARRRMRRPAPTALGYQEKEVDEPEDE